MAGKGFKLEKVVKDTSVINSLHPGKLCMLIYRLLNFFKINFSKNSFRNTISVEHFVGPDLGPNYLQRLLADDTSRSRIKLQSCIMKLNNGPSRIIMGNSILYTKG